MKNRTEVNQAVLKTVSLVLAMTIGFKIMCMPALSRVSAENANLRNNGGGEKISVILPEMADSAELERMYEKYDADTHHEHSVCEGAENCPDDVHAGHNTEEWTEWDNPTAMPTTDGYYFLTTDVTLKASWEPADGTSLCLNGHTLSAENAPGSIIFIRTKNKTFNLCDCTGNGKISGNSAQNESFGGGVTNYGTFNMYSGEISENSAIHCGNGVDNRLEFNMYGGKICKNIPADSDKANLGGGVYTFQNPFGSSKTIFRMYGGEICENTSNIGGGVSNAGGSFFMYGGEIKENKLEITGLDYEGDGAGVSNGGAAEFYMFGGEVTRNIGKINGGVYVYKNVKSVVIGGNAVIKDNTVIKNNISEEKYSNLYLDKEFTVVTMDNTNPLTENSYIGISTGKIPSDGNPVDITGANDKDYSKFFHSDDPAYEVNNSENDVVQLRVHTHNLVQYEAVSPTCTENGYDEHWVCEGENGCGKIFADENAKNELDKKPIIEKLKHDYEDKWRNDPEKHWKKCKNCDAVEPDSENSHDWDEGKITVEPTTEKEGEKIFTCEICGYERKEEIPKLEVSETTTPETSPSETTTPVTPPSETEPPVTSPSETEPPVTPPSETEPPVTSPSETEPPVTSLSETEPPVTSPSETEPPVTPPSETEPPVTPPSETEPPVTSPSETEPPVTSSSETEPPVTPPSETEPPVTSPSETEPPVTPPSETEPPVTPPSETEPPVTPPSETNPPVTPPSETDTPVTPPSETDPPVTPPSETEPPVTPSTESSNFHGGFVIPETSTSTNTAADPVSSYSETIPEETAAQTSDTSAAAGVGTGSISKRVESADYTIELCDSVSELANNVLTNRERLLTDSGSNAEIILTAEKIDTVSESDGIAVREALDDFEVWQYLDINLYKIIDGIRYKLTDTDRAVTVKIVIPETLRENDIEYAVIRVHNGTADVLKDLDSDADTITFATDKFSVYAFVCKDKDVNADSPLNTGVESYTSIFIAVGITSMSAAMTFSLIGVGG